MTEKQIREIITPAAHNSGAVMPLRDQEKSLYALHLKSKIEMLKRLIDGTNTYSELANAVYEEKHDLQSELTSLTKEE